MTAVLVLAGPARGLPARDDGTGVVRVGPQLECVGYGGIRMPDCVKGRPAGP
jgi:hypothetical protein